MTQRVLYFTDSVAFGGAEQAMLTLMVHLDRRDWEPVLVYHPEAGLTPLLQRARQADIETWQVPRMRGRVGAKHLAGFVRALRVRRPSVFHAHLTMPLACKFGLLGAALARVPAVIASEHLYVDIPYRYSVYVERFLEPVIHRYIAVSNDVARQLTAKLGFTRHKTQVVHNGVAIEPFEQVAIAESYQQLPHPLVLTTARLTPQKGISCLLDAAALVPQATFLIAGEGPLAPELRTQAQRLGIAHRVIFAGYVENVPALLRASDLFVLPSLYEGLPLSILEAMAAGVPVIATDVGGIGEAISNESNGLLVPPADPAALANAIRKMLDNRNYAQQLAEAGRARVRTHFSAETMTRRTVDIYCRVLAAGARG